MGVDERLVQKLRICIAVLFWLFLIGCCRQVIAEERPLRIAMSGSFQPFSTTDRDGRLTGFDADIARAVARHMGREPELIQIDWNGIQAGLKSGKYDLICGSMAITEARLEQMAFTLPYYVSGAQLFGPPHKDLERIGVTEGSTYARFILDHPEMFQGAQVTSYGSEAEILTAVGASKVDGFVSDRIVGGYYLRHSGHDEVKPRGDLLYVEACGIAARKGEEALVQETNQAILALIQSGEYGAIYQKWVGDPPNLDLLFQQWGAHAQNLPELSEDVPGMETPKNSDGGTMWLLAQGAWITIKLSLLTAAVSLGTGLLLGVASVSEHRFARIAAAVYVGLVRGTPLLVQLFLSYFVVATMINRWVGYELVGALASALLALIVNTTAYNGETLRGAILGVSRGQWDAAMSLGMKRSRILSRIILPQAFRSCIPSLGNNLVVLVKDTSLVGAITLIELTYAARNVVFQTGQAFTPFLMAALFYLAIISALSVGVNFWEKSLATP